MPGLMQMYLFGSTIAGATTARMDAGMVYHEYTHGLSERLVTDSQGYGALIGPQAGAIAEGTSDFYAMDFLVESEPASVPDTGTQGEVRVGRFLPGPTPRARGLRTEGLDCDVGTASMNCPGTASAGTGGYDYADFGRVGGAAEVHADGEIWGRRCGRCAAR